MFNSSYVYFHGSDDGATILSLITLGKYFESRSKGKTTEAIKKLMDLAPKTAIRLVGGGEEEVPVEDIAIGDILVIKPGSKSSVDGVEAIVSLETKSAEVTLTKEIANDVLVEVITNAGYKVVSID